MIDWKKLILTIVLGIISVILICGISYDIVALIVKGICWAFKFAFSWRLAFGVWLVLALVGSVFGGAEYVN